MLKQKEMKNEEKYDYESLIQMIEETLKQTDSNPITIRSIHNITPSKVLEEEYYTGRIRYYAELFAFRTIYNFRALNVLLPTMIGSLDNKGFLFPINLIMRNIITDFLTSSYLFEVYKTCYSSDDKDYTKLKHAFSSMNIIIADHLKEECNNDTQCIETFKSLLPENFIIDQSNSSNKQKPLMPRSIKKWFDKNNIDLRDTINTYYDSYETYFSKFEHINFLTAEMYMKNKKYNWHCSAIGAGANQIMSCYRILGKTINETELLLLMKKLPNYNPPELKE